MTLKTYQIVDYAITNLDLDMSEIAKKAEMSYSQLSRYRNNKSDISGKSYEKLLEALGKNVAIVIFNNQMGFKTYTKGQAIAAMLDEEKSVLQAA
jgi:transcriptional regulator with XRE-family HTH domain